MIARLGARELQAVDGGSPQISSRVYPNKQSDAIAQRVTSEPLEHQEHAGLADQ
jgi:hypothetical protein